jgi:hypothetical protein
LIRPRTLTVAGAAEALAIQIDWCRTSFPFHPGAKRAGTPRTSALIVQHKFLKSAR